MTETSVSRYLPGILMDSTLFKKQADLFLIIRSFGVRQNIYGRTCLDLWQIDDRQGYRFLCPVRLVIGNGDFEKQSDARVLVYRDARVTKL